MTLGVSSLNDLLAHTRRAAVYPGPRYYANITAKRDKQGDMVLYSRFHSEIGKEYFRPSDELLRSLHARDSGEGAGAA